MSQAENDTRNVDSDQLVRPYLERHFVLSEQELDSKGLISVLTDYINPQHAEAATIVSLVGGAGSGKSTLARQLIEAIVSKGFTADTISTDDYNRGDRQWRWRHFEGATPRDPMEKWDFAFMNAKIDAIRYNRDPQVTIKVPTYNQATGVAIEEGEASYKHEIGPVDVLLVEGDMARVRQPDVAVFIHASDTHRLQNRLGRDLVHRSESDAEKVRANFYLRHGNQHVPYTLPAIESAGLVVEVRADGDGQWMYDVYKRTTSDE